MARQQKEQPKTPQSVLEFLSDPAQGLANMIAGRPILLGEQIAIDKGRTKKTRVYVCCEQRYTEPDRGQPKSDPPGGGD